MRKLLRVCAAVSCVSVGVAAIAACASFGAADATGGDASDDATTDASSREGSAGDAADLDGGNDAHAASVTITTASGVRFAIDAKEITVAEFLAFTKTFDAAAGWASCPGKTALGPKAGCTRTTDDDQPITCVDWCDARAYCVSVGKRLCGKIGGGRIPSTMANDSTLDQWSRACGGSKGSMWPYGGQPKTTACNTLEVAKTVPVTVGSLAQCVGGEPGLFDMSGNVVEWEDACVDGGAQCLLRGGSFKRNVNQSACGALVLSAVSDAYDDVGFRCCNDL